MDVTLTLVGPILTRGGMAPDPGVDAPMARDGLGRPMLPFSLVKGKIRDAFLDTRPAGDPLVADWLGKQSATELEPARGRLRFTDFATEEEGNSSGLIERISIDAKTGSVAPQMLVVQEAPFGYGQKVKFKGAVEFAATESELAVVEAALEEAFRWVPAYGAMRTVGYGRTHEVAHQINPCANRSSGKPQGTTSFPLRLRFDRPLCLVGRKHSRNHFESLECVSGAVLKGAVSSLILELTQSRAKWIDPSAHWPAWQTLCRNFEHIRFAEARAIMEPATERPVVPPLSLVTVPNREKDRETEFFDIALKKEPHLIADMAPAFAPDWKYEDELYVWKQFGWPSLPRERRTRTAIEETLGRAKDESLFSYGLVLPQVRRSDVLIESFVWYTCVNVGDPQIPEADRATILDELADLLTYGLPGIGKTRATAKIDWLGEPLRPAVAESRTGTSEHVITLQTEFLMTDPESLRQGRPEDLRKAYSEFWTEISCNVFVMERFFARQDLLGGFLSKRSRFQRYEPFLATVRGSTFVLRSTNDERAADTLNHWREHGLDLPKWIEKRFRITGKALWQSCPFLPSNGFGEVAIDLACHTENRSEGPRP